MKIMPGILSKILSSPIPSSLSALPPGKEGVVKTLNVMSDLVRTYKASPDIRRLAVAICGTINGNDKDYAIQLIRIFNYVQKNIGYIRDIYGVETIQSPLFTLQSKSGDCDDKSTLLATLLSCVGFPTRFFAMGFSPGVYCHVICEAKYNGQWISLDATENKPLGWRPPNIVTGYYVENTQ